MESFKHQVVQGVQRQKEFVPAERFHQALTAKLEKHFLIAVAKRLPPWIKSDHLTLFAFLGSILACFAYYMTNQALWWIHVASLGIFITWFGDALDGTIARVRNVGRERYGFYLDHLLDMLSVLFVFTGLALSPFVSLIPAMAGLITYYLLAMYAYLLTYVAKVLKLSYGIMGPTETRIILVLFQTFYVLKPDLGVTIAGHYLTLFEVMLLIVAMVIGATFLISALQTLIILDEIDPLVDD
ncbi:hypothetical protein COS81_01020 [candidate division WWE3 bacterium CG06_land_8_20_14_3_00_42_16]|uniref:CDP-alcohol phosphatidyltransferase n=2 Tax=Katanobacteria TaxID=422282 RepID=A0A2M7AP94_UNCKA|nr:MAG: hypothetical protein AUJ38_01380 [bacterium CG1_02_42_9]PIU69187.1 MAG: hypothetical protein COS81_01020 [candidate division WWE3 bacterium CG06_land_8_20_14_3_00_42_16]